MPVNDPAAELIGMSPTKFNAMAVVGLTGAEISTLAAGSPSDGRIVYCYLSNGTYTQGHWYGWDDVLNTFIDLNGLPDFYDYFKANVSKGFVDRRNATKEMWYCTNSGAGSAVNNALSGTNQVIELVTGTTTTGVATIQIGGPSLDYSKKAFMMVKIETPSVVTGQIVKIGTDIDTAGTGPATRKMFGIEYCDGDTDWQIHSANGTNQNNFDTTLAVATSDTKSWIIELNPGSNVTAKNEGGTTYTKNTNVPSSGAGLNDALMKISICNNNASATSKTLKVHSAMLVYVISDSNWVA